MGKEELLTRKHLVFNIVSFILFLVKVVRSVAGVPELLPPPDKHSHQQKQVWKSPEGGTLSLKVREGVTKEQ